MLKFKKIMSFIKVKILGTMKVSKWNSWRWLNKRKLNYRNLRSLDNSESIRC